MKNGFTLLELLIVISIVGILASVTMISYPSVTKKARLANAIKFSDNVRGSLQPEMVAWWKFDETSGTVAKDSWWNQLHGTINGATWVQGIKGNALSFDGASSYVNMGNNIFLKPSGAFTYSVWFKIPVTQSSRMLLGDWISGTGIVIGISDSQSNRLKFHMNSASAENVLTNSTDLNNNQWYYTVGIWDGVTATLYLNGDKVDTKTTGMVHTASSINFNIGRWVGGSSQYFNGLIDDVQIYSVALPVAVIQQHYAEGLPTHQNLAISN